MQFLLKERASFSKRIEVEVKNIEDAIKAAEAGADIIMFDNMKPEDIEKAIIELKMRGLRNRVLLEASGGINEENIELYALLDVDVISLSEITIAAKPVDMSLKVVEVVEG